LVTGILRATPVRVNPKLRTIKSVYKMHLDVLHIRKTLKGRIQVAKVCAVVGRWPKRPWELTGAFFLAGDGGAGRGQPRV
jgi:hypothetical protein